MGPTPGHRIKIPCTAWHGQKVKEKRKNKATTVSRKLSSLRGFYKFLINRDYTGVNPFTLVKTPRKEKKLPRFFYYNELEEMFDVKINNNEELDLILKF